MYEGYVKVNWFGTRNNSICMAKIIRQSLIIRFLSAMLAGEISEIPTVVSIVRMISPLGYPLVSESHTVPRTHPHSRRA